MPPRLLLLTLAATLGLTSTAAAQGGRLTVTAPATATLGQAVIVHFSGEGANNPTYPETNVFAAFLPPGNSCPDTAESAKGYYPAQDRKVIIDKQVPAHPAFEFDDDAEPFTTYSGTWVLCAYLWTGSMGSTPDATSFSTITVAGATPPPPPPPPPPGALTVAVTSTSQTKAKIRASGFSFSVAPNRPGRLTARVYVRSGSKRYACGKQITATYAATGAVRRSGGKPARTSTCARTLRRSGAKTIVVVWSFTDTAGATKSGTTPFRVRR